MQDIAEKIGVSTVTVSKALSGQRGVSESLRSRIIALAKEMGYTPKTRESSRAAYTIGILTAKRFLDGTTSFYDKILQLLSEEISRIGSTPITQTISSKAEKNASPPLYLEKSNIDGVIVLGTFSDPYLEMLREKCPVPLVYLDHLSRFPGQDCVLSDGFYGMYQMTNYLLQLGHTKIGFAGTLGSTSSVTQRFLGYRMAMKEQQLPIREEWVIGDRDPNTGLLIPSKEIALPPELPTAFVCNSDLTAAFLLNKLEALGLTCPEDISITGFDNYSYPVVSGRQFTTYEVNMKEMARKSVNILTHRINGDYCRAGSCIVAGRLIERDTVRAIEFMNIPQ